MYSISHAILILDLVHYVMMSVHKRYNNFFVDVGQEI